MTIKEWDSAVKKRSGSKQCAGFFFFSYGRKHSFRRCEAAVEVDGMTCGVCGEMRDRAKDGIVKPVGPAYNVVDDALGSRPGVLRAIAFWNKRSKELKEQKKLAEGFPFFSAKEVVHILVEGMVVRVVSSLTAASRSGMSRACLAGSPSLRSLRSSQSSR